MFTHDRRQLREVFFRAWRNHRDHLPLSGVENIIVDIALRHPEYQPLLEHPERHEEQDYLPEMGATNPFLHMGMHIAIAEQLSIDQPHGVRALYQRLLQQSNDPHDAQHRAMECLSEMVWQAQRNGTAPDEAIYLSCLKRLVFSA